ncbi:LPXTG cell wall anchor domain-containing protein [Alkalicoccobacillus porphyridii]|uniref:LPXTG cell wall anchor domain-containing protein n=1 Tax=Alkalicoccobacillus porphyridii TaxID=2597270 RepID=A0A553ZTN7_9BACI|nr:LPXTG cell wall anchor domain-containing protein [Alkalicoccobacillus porphyridii]
MTDGGASEQPPVKKGGQKLPETAMNLYVYLLAGVLLIISGVVFLFIKRRKAKSLS